MSLLPLDVHHLATAVGLARAAVGLASPNPTVGCIIANGESVLGEGAHHYDARDHAEIAALKHAASFGHSVRGATAYVTLEPCSHHGRTGPCADALIAAGITRCVIATVDPNPLVSGAGIAKLRAANIAVDILDPGSPLATAARTLNDAFAWAIKTGGLPFVTLKAALSVDGKLAPPPSQRTTVEPHWITGLKARIDAQDLRHSNDAILTGIGTVLADNPSLTDRTDRPRRRRLLRVVLDADLRTPTTSKLALTANQDVLLVCRAHAPEESEAALRAKGIDIFRLVDNSRTLSLCAVLDVLGGHNIQSVLVEAGAMLNGSFLREDLVQKVVFYYAERELGLDAIPFAANYESPYVTQQRLTRTARNTFPNNGSEDIRIAGYLYDPWADIV